MNKIKVKNDGSITINGINVREIIFQNYTDAEIVAGLTRHGLQKGN